MERFLTFFRRISWQSVVLLMAIGLIGLPSLLVGWMIVDDGADLLIARNITHFLTSFDWEGLWGILLEKETGRFRPAIWLYLWLTYLIGGYDPFIHHLVNFILRSSTVILIYFIIKLLTSSKSASLIGGLVFTLSPFNLENWYRLGPVEPKITFFLAFSVYFLIRILGKLSLARKAQTIEMVLAFLPIPFIYFLKETSFVLLFFPLTLLLSFKKFKVLKLYFIFNCFFALSSLVINTLIRPTGSYSVYYKLALSNIISTGQWYLKLLTDAYGIIFLVIFVSFFVSCCQVIKTRRTNFLFLIQFSFLAGFLSMYVIQLPWLIPMGRYFEPALFFFSLFTGLETKNILDLKFTAIKFPVSSKHYLVLSPGKIKTLIFLLGFFLLIFKYLFPTYNYVKDTIMGQANSGKIWEFLAGNVPQNGKVFWNLAKREGTEELIIESNNLLNLVYGRPDLKVFYLNESSLKQIQKGDVILSGLADEGDKLYKDEELIKRMKLKLINLFVHEKETIIFRPRGLVPLVKAVVFKRPLPIRAFFDRSFIRPQWMVYRVILE